MVDLTTLCAVVAIVGMSLMFLLYLVEAPKQYKKKQAAIEKYQALTGVSRHEAAAVVERAWANPVSTSAKTRQFESASQQSDGIRDLLREGKRDQARQVYQLFTGVDQFTADEAIKALEAEVRMEEYDIDHAVLPDAQPDAAQKHRYTPREQKG